MRQVFIIILSCIFFLASCQQKPKDSSLSVQDLPTDTIDATVDSLEIEQQLTEEMQQPSNADELFDDFLFTYADNSRFQISRTIFPLPYYDHDSSTYISRNDWHHNNIFSQNNTYSILFDREKDMDCVIDTTLTSVQVEFVMLASKTVKKYYFEKKNRAWMLEAINIFTMADEDFEFLHFYHQFASDSTFQYQHIASNIQLVTIDPEDEFSILETTIKDEQWPAFKPLLSADSQSFINYGQPNNAHSSHKIMKINSIGSGETNVLYFRRKGTQWELYKFEDVSI